MRQASSLVLASSTRSPIADSSCESVGGRCRRVPRVWRVAEVPQGGPNEKDHATDCEPCAELKPKRGGIESRPFPRCKLIRSPYALNDDDDGARESTERQGNGDPGAHSAATRRQHENCYGYAYRSDPDH